MSILVICPGCKKQFQVSEKFAGKSGPCPQCKAVIKVPKKEEQVVVHTPEQFGSGGRGASGKLALKPIARLEGRLRGRTMALIAVAAVLVLAVTLLGGRQRLFVDHVVVSVMGLLLISPALVIGGYQFLNGSEELERYRGKSLWLRAGICALAYVVLWGLFIFVLGYVSGPIRDGEIWIWFFVAPPFFVVGSLAALSALDLDFSTGFFHYAFYVLVTMLLRWAAGLPSVWSGLGP
jgi:type IV secretory pathway VirB2 component (pilin)